LKRHDLELRRIEEERRDDLVNWTTEHWVSRSGRLDDWTLGGRLDDLLFKSAMLKNEEEEGKNKTRGRRTHRRRRKK